MTYKLEPKDSSGAPAPRAAVATPPAEKASPPGRKRRNYLIAFAIVLIVLIACAIVATLMVGRGGTKSSDAPRQQRIGLASAGASSDAFRVGGASTGPTAVNQLLSSISTPVDRVSPFRAGPLAVHGILP